MQESLGRLSRVVFCQCDVMNRIDAASSGGIMGLFFNAEYMGYGIGI